MEKTPFLHSYVFQDGSVDSKSFNMDDISIEPLPGLEAIFDELLKEVGYEYEDIYFCT